MWVKRPVVAVRGGCLVVWLCGGSGPGMVAAHAAAGGTSAAALNGVAAVAMFGFPCDFSLCLLPVFVRPC